MEENSESQVQTQAPQEETSNSVSFPSVGQPKKSGSKTLLVIGILVLLGILGFVIFKSATKNNNAANSEPTPFDNLTQGSDTVETPTPAATSSATPKPVDKTSVEIQVQNGTGISGEAAYLQTQLKTLGYTNVKVGNAGSQSETSTTVTFSSTLDASVVSELTAKLKALYQTVVTKTSGSQTFDVVIVTGLRVGATAKPTSSPTPKPSSSPSASPTATP